jgi:hypothetical protein
MALTVEFFAGLIITFLIGYLLASGMEKLFHIHLK